MGWGDVFSGVAVVVSALSLVLAYRLGRSGNAKAQDALDLASEANGLSKAANALAKDANLLSQREVNLQTENNDVDWVVSLCGPGRYSVKNTGTSIARDVRLVLGLPHADRIQEVAYGSVDPRGEIEGFIDEYLTEVPRVIELWRSVQRDLAFASVPDGVKTALAVDTDSSRAVARKLWGEEAFAAGKEWREYRLEVEDALGMDFDRAQQELSTLKAKDRSVELTVHWSTDHGRGRHADLGTLDFGFHFRDPSSLASAAEIV